MNCWTVACSDAINVVSSRIALYEDEACWLFDFRLFTASLDKHERTHVRFRVDNRSIRYEDAIAACATWWENMPEYGHRDIPDYCRMPTYSTWYSFHQRPDATSVEKQAALSKRMGCENVILDDGWQMEGAPGNYIYCGDWEEYKGSFPDMAGHVRRVHELGMKYMLWFSVPYVGERTRTWKRFQGMFLPGTGNVRTLDPRYPVVREYLRKIYLRAVRDWDIDGCKLDFIDCFLQPEKEDPDALPGRDYTSVGEAVCHFLEDVTASLLHVKPDFAIEFRQTYIGPLMRRYATMYRSGDCAGDFRQNKVNTINLRLMSGETVIHSDMLLWNAEEPVERVAMQFQHVLFSVPQISVRIDEMPQSHQQVLAFWLGFWRKHGELLLRGIFRAHHPELGYSLVTAQNETTFLAVSYGNNCIDLAPGSRHQIIVNCTFDDRVALRAPRRAKAHAMLYDCLGNLIESTDHTVAGLFELPIPPAGFAEITLKRDQARSE